MCSTYSVEFELRQLENLLFQISQHVHMIALQILSIFHFVSVGKLCWKVLLSFTLKKGIAAGKEISMYGYESSHKSVGIENNLHVYFHI